MASDLVEGAPSKIEPKDTSFQIDYPGWIHWGYTQVTIWTFVFGAALLGTFSIISLFNLFMTPGPISFILAALGGIASGYGVGIVYTKESDDTLDVFIEKWQQIFSALIHLRLGYFFTHFISQVFSIIKGAITGYAAYIVFMNKYIGLSYSWALGLGIAIGAITYLVQSTKLVNTGLKLFGCTNDVTKSKPHPEPHRAVLPDHLKHHHYHAKKDPVRLSFWEKVYHWAIVWGHIVGQAAPAYMVLVKIFMPTFEPVMFTLCLIGGVGTGIYCGWFYGDNYRDFIHQAADDLHYRSGILSDAYGQSQMDKRRELTISYSELLTQLNVITSIIKGTLSLVSMYFFMTSALAAAPWIAALVASTVAYSTCWAQGVNIARNADKTYLWPELPEYHHSYLNQFKMSAPTLSPSAQSTELPANTNTSLNYWEASIFGGRALPTTFGKGTPVEPLITSTKAHEDVSIVFTAPQSPGSSSF